MKIVIDIPEDLYKGIERRDGALETEYVCDELMKAVDNGTPLPKGHGRLIDADKVVTEAKERMKYPANHKYMECVIAHMELAPTIIEAERTESEGV